MIQPPIVRRAACLQVAEMIDGHAELCRIGGNRDSDSTFVCVLLVVLETSILPKVHRAAILAYLKKARTAPFEERVFKLMDQLIARLERAEKRESK